MTSNLATVTVITSPVGVDVGPVAAHLGRNLGDGLAIRTIDPGALRRHHTPIGFAAGHTVTPPGEPHTVDLGCLPAAWRNPDTNLGVAIGPVARGASVVDVLDQIRDDIAAMARLAAPIVHRLTVQGAPLGIHVWPNIEQCERPQLAEAARDSVLRSSAATSRQVLIEAGDGQTFLDALATLGLAPWEPSIDSLDLWLVVDATTPPDAIRAEVVRQGGTPALDGYRLGRLHLAVLNFQQAMPELAGVNTARFQLPGGHPDGVSNADADHLDAWTRVIANQVGARVDLIGTSPDGATIIDLTG